MAEKPLTVATLLEGSVDLGDLEKLVTQDSPGTVQTRLGAPKRNWSGIIEDGKQQLALTLAKKFYDTRTGPQGMDADFANQPMGMRAQIDNDPIETNNGQWKRGASAWEKTELQPASEADVDEVRALIAMAKGPEIAKFRDQRGFVGFLINAIGGLKSQILDVSGRFAVDAAGAVKTDKLNTKSGGTGIRMRDRLGFVGVDIDPLKPFVLFKSIRTLDGFNSADPIPGAAGFSASDIAAHDGAAMSFSALLNGQPFNGFQPMGESGIDVILVTGQSWDNGKSCGPSLTRVSMPGVTMIGSSARGLPGSVASPAWAPIGAAQLNPAVAVTQNNSAPGQVLSRSAEAALTYPTGYNGEEPGVASAQMLRKAWLAARGIQSDPERELLVINVSVGGATIDELSNDALYYQRVPQALQQIKDLAGIRSVALIATLFGQGQANYNNPGGTTEQQYYDAAVNYRAKIDASVLTIFGQAKQALFITRQVSGAVWTQNHLNIGNAQRRLAQEQPNWILATPDYLVPADSVPGEGSHPTNNGIRWLACYMGWSLIQALIYGRKVRPLQPYKAVMRGQQMLVTFDAPVPGLRAKPFYGPSGALVTVPNHGLYATDASGEIAMTGVEFVGEVTALISLARLPGSTPRLWAGRRSQALGGTNICDGSTLVPPFNYEYHADYGQPAAENIAALVGKPYPMNNFCVAFSIPVVAG